MILRLLATALLLALLAACAPSRDAATSPVQEAIAHEDSPPKAPDGTESPPGKTTPGTTKAIGNVDYSCTTDADCTVKDVGNCCGYYPACVNVNSPTDPAGVQASCQAKGMMSVCGFAEIQGCSCVNGQCASAGSSDPLRQPMTENPAAER